MNPADQTALAERLRSDFPWYSQHCLKITDTRAQSVPFVLKPAQLRIDAMLEQQRAAGKPMRLIVPKARKEGVSTYATGRIIQRATQRQNHNAIQVAQDSDTAGELLAMAEMMYGNLPDTKAFAIKPPIANRLRRKEIVWGNPAKASRETGDLGLNSRLIVQPAGEFEAGRGYTFHSVHGSECAFWPDLKRKLTSLLNAVPDEEETLVLLESTANGHNHWRTLCTQAENGENDFEICFLPWFAEPQYVKPFLGEEERAEFAETVGTGPYGQHEPDLVEVHDVTLEQLNWRRWAIANRCQGDLRVYAQEYPSTLSESWGATGRQVFNSDHVARARVLVESLPEGEKGKLAAGSTKPFQARFGRIEIPQAPKWTPSPAGDWLIFQHPVKDAQYIVSGDPAGDDVGDETAAMHAGQVIDHATGGQVAELEFQGDTDTFAEQLFLAALLYNRAWVVIENTGGYGSSAIRRIHKDWRHPYMYRRRPADSRADNAESDRLGWDTNRQTRPMLMDGGVELLREETHGIHSRRLMRQFSTFIKDNRGKPVPAPGERSDLLMAWLIAQHVRLVLPVRRQKGSGVISTGREVRDAVTGW